jgi:hypothetical protein
MNSARRTAALPAVGFPIRRSPDQSLVSGSPKLIAATRVLHRLLSPRHPSCALFSLVIVSSRSRQRKRASAKTKVQLGRNRAVVNRRKAPVTRTTKCLFFSFLRVCNFQRSQIDRKSRRGGADRDRTDDIQLAKLALSQLSYGPFVVGLDRFELSTPRLSSVCSNQLSYRPSLPRLTARSASHGDLQRTGRSPFGPKKPDSRSTWTDCGL